MSVVLRVDIGPGKATVASEPASLVVTADDFGMGVETSRGIIDAHRRGPVTATSMVTITGDAARVSVALLAREDRLDVGIHLVFSNIGSKPLAAGARASGLVGRDGMFLPLPKLMLNASARRIDPQAVRHEIAAQAEMFTRLLGRPPSHVDGHHHAHQFPIIREALIDSFAAGVFPADVRVRVTREPPAVRRHVRHARVKRAVLHRLGIAAARRFQEAGLRTNEWFMGILDSRRLHASFPWEPYLRQLPSHGLTELMVHPGYADPWLAGKDGYRQQRVLELSAMLDGRLRLPADSRRSD